MMKKVSYIVIFAFIIVGLLSSNSSFAQRPVLRSGVQENYTIDQARQEAFNNAQFFRNISGFPAKDPFFFENKTAILQAKTSTIKFKNRIISVFYDYDTKQFNAYAVKEDNSDKIFYFDKNGKLQSIDYEQNTTQYPKKAYRYSYPKGKLIVVSFDVSGSDSFLFRPTGELISHCLNEKCYDANGRPHTLRFNIK